MTLARSKNDILPRKYILGDERLVRCKLKKPLTINGITKYNEVVQYYEIYVEENGFSSFGIPDYNKWIPSRWV